MSPFRVSFEHEFQFRSVPGLPQTYPALVVGLIGPGGQDDCLAIFDTGASYSLFDGKRAKSIGLDLTSGTRINLSGLSGDISAWLHRVTLDIEGSKFECEVAFSEAAIGRELLGRSGLFTRIRLALREGQSCFYFHPAP